MTRPTTNLETLLAALDAKLADLRAMIAESREPAAPAKSEPGGYWSPWLEWRGGPCPLPGRVECQFQHGEGLAEYRSTGDAHLIKDWRREGRFRYRAPDKLGWLPRGEWIPPAELWADHCSVRLEWLVDDGVAPYSGDKPPSTWRGVTHVRLVAREVEPEWKDDTAAALLHDALTPEEISGEKQGARVDELVRWMVRFGDGHANPKWLAQHAAELAYYAYQQRLVPRERKTELPEGWSIDAIGTLRAKSGAPIMVKDQLAAYGPAAIRQAVDAYLREIGGE